MKRRITVLAAVLVVALVVVLLVGVFYQAPVDLMAIPPDLVASIPKSEQRNPLVYVEQVIRSNGTREEQARYLASGSNFENANRVWLKWDIIYRLAQDRVRKAKKAKLDFPSLLREHVAGYGTIAYAKAVRSWVNPWARRKFAKLNAETYRIFAEIIRRESATNTVAVTNSP